MSSVGDERDLGRNTEDKHPSGQTVPIQPRVETLSWNLILEKSSIREISHKSPFQLFNSNPEFRFHGGRGFLDARADAFKQMYYRSMEENQNCCHKQAYRQKWLPK